MFVVFRSTRHGGRPEGSSMSNQLKLVALVTAALVAGLGFWAVTGNSKGPPPARAAADAPADTDEAPIRKEARAFAAAFAKGDAKGIAAMWTEKGECRMGGETFVGRAAIEKAYAAFFKANPGHKV